MKELYEVYLDCVDKEVLMYDDFIKFVSEKNREIVEYRESGMLQGISILEKNKILFLGVSKKYRNKKTIGVLIKLAEDKIFSKGYNKIILNSIIDPKGGHDFAVFDEIGYEDLFIKADYLFNKDNFVNKSLSECDFKIDDYQLIKDNILGIDLKKLSKLNFRDKLLACVKNGKLVGYCQCSVKKFRETDELVIIENLCLLLDYCDFSIEEAFIAKAIELFNVKKVLLCSYENYSFRQSNIHLLYLEHITAVRFI